MVQFAGKTITFIVAILSTAVIAKSLGPEYFGNYTIILAYLSFAAAFGDLGLQTIAVREAAKREERTAQLAACLFWIKGFWGGGVLVLATICLSFLRFERMTKVGFAIAAIGVMFTSLTAVPNMIFQSKIQLQYSTVADIAGQTLFLVLAALIAYAPTLHSPFYLYLTAGNVAAFTTFAVAMLLASRMGKLSFQFDRSTAEEMVKSTLPLSVIFLLSQIHFKGDTILLSLLKPDRDVGIYGLAYRFFEASLIVPAVLMSSIFPLLSRHHNESDTFTVIARKSFFLLLPSGLAVAIVIYFLSPHLLLWVGGKSFAESVFPLRMLGLALIFSFINSLFAYIVIVMNRQKDILFISASGVMLNLLLNLLFIPRYSYKACATITVITECYGMCLMGYLAYKASGFNPFCKRTRANP
jgi:O-antigen/teichoic acid export membrane protein